MLELAECAIESERVLVPMSALQVGFESSKRGSAKRLPLRRFPLPHFLIVDVQRRPMLLAQTFYKPIVAIDGRCKGLHIPNKSRLKTFFLVVKQRVRVSNSRTGKIRRERA